MTKSITFLAAAATLLTATAAHAADREQRFTKDGQVYAYTKTVNGPRTIIEGRSVTSGEKFHLIVRGDRVTGTTAGQPVSFRVAEAAGAAQGATVLAAN